MPPLHQDECVLVTGASGHIGRAVTVQFRDSNTPFLATDLSGGENTIVICDLTVKQDVVKLFAMRPIRTVIHLAGILPSAFHEDPLRGAALNLTASLNLITEAIEHRVKRFVFASSLSVYGLTRKSERPLTEDDPAAPDEAYGACKRAIELVGEALDSGGAIDFVALRIGRVIGPGIKKTSSPWRAEMFESESSEPLLIPYGATAELCLMHVEDTARTLIVLAETSSIRRCVYNAPAEIWTTNQLKEIIERTSGRRVVIGPDEDYAGATCDGSRFQQEFGFQMRGVRERLFQTFTTNPRQSRA